MHGKKIESWDDDFAFPYIETKKMKTWWDCGHCRHHRII
jgi:hypothetical protein